MKVLIADPIAQDGIEILSSKAQVDVRTGLSQEELISLIGDYDALVVRSETKVTADVIRAGRKLRVIGRAGVGVDNIDVDTATQHGIAVVNAPTGNTVAAAELTIGLMLALARNIPQAHHQLRNGLWERSRFLGVEVRNKTLGIIGLGRVGSEVARRAEAMEMKVIAYDPFVSVEHAQNLGAHIVSLEQLLREADIITIHTPLSEGTTHLIGEKELEMVKPSAMIINVARGGIVDESALLRALDENKVSGAALDVFSQEPLPPDSPLIKNNRVVLTPHLGASTQEAQTSVAVDVAQEILSVLQGQPARYAVNAPLLSPETAAVISPLLPVATLLGNLAAQISEGQPNTVHIKYEGDIANYDTSALKAAVIGGMLQPVSEERITVVNAGLVAAQRGIKMLEHKGPIQQNYQNLITVEMESSTEPTTVSGTMMRGEAHIVQVNGYWQDVVPTAAYLLLCENMDSPGIIGAVGTLLGSVDINVAFMQVGRDKPRGKALMILGLDEPVNEEHRQQILNIPRIYSVKQVKL